MYHVRLMSDTIKIAPSMLPADSTRLADAVQAAEAAGADYTHVDVMDGHFVPTITDWPLVVREVRRATRLPLDVHLMINEPGRYVPDLAESGADGVIVHIEATPHVHRLLQQIRESGSPPGVSLSPGTLAGAVCEILDDVNLVLVDSPSLRARSPRLCKYETCCIAPEARRS